MVVLLLQFLHGNISFLVEVVVVSFKVQIEQEANIIMIHGI
jgi:hypothetical protein